MITIQKSILFVYSCNKPSEIDLYTSNNKTLLRLVKEGLQKGEIFCGQGSEDVTLLKYQFSPNSSIEPMQSQSKYQQTL
jgi:hypothetical protein